MRLEPMQMSSRLHCQGLRMKRFSIEPPEGRDGAHEWNWARLCVDHFRTRSRRPLEAGAVAVVRLFPFD